MKLRSGVAVDEAVAGSCSSDLTPSLGISICRRCGPKTQNKKKEKKEKKKKQAGGEDHPRSIQSAPSTWKR